MLRQQKARRSTSGSLLSSYDESAVSALKNTASIANEAASPLKRESYERASIFSEADSADSTFQMEETVRHLHLEDRPPYLHERDHNPYYQPPSLPSLHPSRSRPGMKRKQPGGDGSPPSEVSHGNAQLLAAAAVGIKAEPYPRNTPSSQLPSQRRSPVHQFGQSQGSFSSQSSGGPRTGSYASSGGLSVGGSSNTSVDQNHPSPGGISPLSEQQQQQQQQQHHFQHQNDQDSPYVTSLPMNPRNPNSRPQQHYPPLPLDNDATPPNPPHKTNHNPAQRRGNAPNMQTQSFICQCCPKKPKKFDTEQELR